MSICKLDIREAIIETILDNTIGKDNYKLLDNGSKVELLDKSDNFIEQINNYKPDILQVENVSLNQTNNQSLQEGLDWLKEVNPNVQPEIVQGLIDGIANGSYNSNLDLITLSEEFADKKTVKHEFTHLTTNSLFETEEHYVLNKMISNGVIRKKC